MYFMTVLIFPLVSIYLLQHSFWINFFVSSGKLRPSTTCLMPPTKPTIFSRSLSLTSAWKSCFLLSLPERPFQNFSALKPVYRRLGTKKSFLSSYFEALERWNVRSGCKQDLFILSIYLSPSAFAAPSLFRKPPSPAFEISSSSS